MVLGESRKRSEFFILPPSGHVVPGIFRNRSADSELHDDLLAKVQRFRGRIYLEDGAVTRRELTSDGRHNSPVDEASWHVVSLDSERRVCACLRFLEESNAKSFDDLWVRNAAAARSTQGSAFRRALEGELAGARKAGLRFGEVGGWAVAESHRRTTEPLRIILATYGLLELLGSCVGVATATWRHSSAAILRRIGLTSLSVDGRALPPYHDPQYDCSMEVLRFDSRLPNPRYRSLVQELGASLKAAPTICTENMGATLQNSFWNFDMPAAEPSFGSLVPVN